jgi:hypothetical protein
MSRDWQGDWELCEKATPGPLSILPPYPTEYGIEWEVATEQGKGIWVAHCQGEHDARFIAEAREALPYWLQRVKELEVKVKELEENFEEAKGEIYELQDYYHAIP